MTAIVAVLNKNGIGIAADSAVTIGNTHKVINSANKVFMLSKYHPVGIATYGNSQFMGIPWELIIKNYRECLKKQDKATIEEYAKDFISYLHGDNLKRLFEGGEKSKIIGPLLFKLWTEVCDNKDTPDKIVKKLQGIKQNMEHLLVCEELKDYSKECFYGYADNAFSEFFKKKSCTDESVKVLCQEIIFQTITRNFWDVFTSGLVFFGFGSEEFFPSIESYNISVFVDNKLKYFKDNRCIKSNISGVAVIPFAQRDVVDTIMQGINPHYKDIITGVSQNVFSNLIQKIKNELVNNGCPVNMLQPLEQCDLKAIMGGIVSNTEAEMAKHYTSKLMRTIESFDKEDLARVAESLVSLTSQMRRMTPGEETVGGPIDVAVVSKCDGFIWIKRKHYFKPELNQQFFYNYNLD